VKFIEDEMGFALYILKDLKRFIPINIKDILFIHAIFSKNLSTIH
jgi:hypothetical protein